MQHYVIVDLLGQVPTNLVGIDESYVRLSSRPWTLVAIDTRYTQVLVIGRHHLTELVQVLIQNPVTTTLYIVCSMLTITTT